MKKQHHVLFILLVSLIVTGCQVSLPSSQTESFSTDLSTSDSQQTTSDLSHNESTTSSQFSSTESGVTSSSEAISTSSISQSSTITATSSESTTSTPASSAYLYSGYYQGLQGLTDAQLMGTLRPLLRQALGNDGLFPSTVTYQTAIGTLQEADQDPSNANNVIIWYRMTSVNKTWDSGSTWNREHVWPQSLLNVSTSSGSRHKGADAHNLKPANPSDNSSRGNKYFSEVNSSNSYVPPESIRGDIARILFYMVTMYPDLSLVDVTSGSPSTYQMAQFSLMVKWHLQDPVDDFEARRNNVIFQNQANRNPFIDHEELVCRMFRNQTTQAAQYCLA
jgi:endonuclease I